MGAALFIVGAAVLGFGVVGYVQPGDQATPAQSASETESDPTEIVSPERLEDVEGLPVAVAYNSPEREVPVIVVKRLIIERFEMDAPVVELGMDEEGVPHVPLNGKDVAWYNFSARPGSGSNAVFAGHINWEGALGPFGRLAEMQSGDTVRLVTDEGHELTYEVFKTFAVDPVDPESLKVMAPTERDVVTLITCGGSWIPDPSERFGGQYTDRTIVKARLVDSTVSVPGLATANVDG